MFKLFKGLFVFLICLLSVTLTTNIKAANAYFVWEKVVIDVAVNTALEEYKDDYIIKFYVDGKLSDDFTVEYEVNASTFSTVLTHIIGRYTVYYKAYSKNNYISSTQAIIFNVVDNISPEVEILSDPVVVDYGKDLTNYQFYKVSDNYTKNKDLKVEIIDSNVLYNTLGIYDASIKAYDEFYNETIKTFKVKVADRVSPNIMILKPLEFSYNEEISLDEYFLCEDNYFGNLTSFLKVTGLDLKKLGMTELTVSCSDLANNTTTLTLYATVVDNIPPNFLLISDELLLDIKSFESYDYNYFFNYIFSYGDNYDEKENLKIDIDISNLAKEVLDYKVLYTVTDTSGNKLSKSLLVRVRELTGPVITCSDEIRLNVNEEYDFLKDVTVYDEYDPNAIDRLIVDYADLDVSLEGIYYITYSCLNSSGVYTMKTVKVIVGDNVEPVSNDIDIVTPILIGLIFVILTIVIIILIKKKRKSK